LAEVTARPVGGEVIEHGNRRGLFETDDLVAQRYLAALPSPRPVFGSIKELTRPELPQPKLLSFPGEVNFLRVADRNSSRGETLQKVAVDNGCLSGMSSIVCLAASVGMPASLPSLK